MTEPIRLVIVDDHSIVRHGLRLILELEPGITVVGEAAAAAAALPLIGALQPDIVLLDLSLGAGDPTEGLELCRTITTQHPNTSVIVLTTFLEERLVLQAIRSGARGYVLKDVDAVELVRSVRAVSRGESALDARSASVVLKNLAGANGAHSVALEFSPREIEVIRLLAQGCSNRAIGERIAISESTVKFHLRNIMRKLEVNSRTEIVYAAGKLGLL